jgi:RNA polymerase sigma factor (sigma-70 family)
LSPPGNHSNDKAGIVKRNDDLDGSLASDSANCDRIAGLINPPVIRMSDNGFDHLTRKPSPSHSILGMPAEPHADLSTAGPKFSPVLDISPVTEQRLARSKGVSEATLAATIEVSRGGEVNFERLYESSRDDVYAYAASLLRDRAAAEDVTATAFERAYRKRSRFDPRRGNGRAWLFGIARNAALDELRRRGRQAELAVDPEDAAGLAGADHAERNEQRLMLSNALGRLEAGERELVALKFFAGLDNGEIARVLGVSESNAGTKLHRVVTKLREACDGAL